MQDTVDPQGDGVSPLCLAISANLSALQDNELNPEQRSFVENHLATCGECAAIHQAMQRTDSLIQREWRENASLPLPSERRRAIDSIMDALPLAPETLPVFTPKRVHAKARWMRFAMGVAGTLMALGLLASSYLLGYTNGRRHALPGSPDSYSSPPAAKAAALSLPPKERP
jgi:anti-sigma factor RsiW